MDHFLTILRVHKYMRIVKDMKITFRGDRSSPLPDSHVRLTLYSDSDCSLGSTDMRSYLGNVVNMNDDLVGWYTSKQSIVDASSTEAEDGVMSDVCKDVLSLNYFLGVFVHVLAPIPVYMDNQGALFMDSNRVTNKRFKHIDRRYHVMWDHITKRLFRLEYISTNINIADFMNKGL